MFNPVPYIGDHKECDAMAEFQYSIYKDKQNNLLRVNVSGLLTRGGAMSMVKQARESAYKDKLNLLYDMRAMQLPNGLKLSEIIDFVRNHESLNIDKASEIRSASLVISQLLSDEVWEVYQYASRNAGLQWQFFTEERSAIEWLIAL